jgi:DNA-binding CsgD family transcriptional regulator
MAQQESGTCGKVLAGRLEAGAQWTARPHASEPATSVIARQLNGPLTALLLYMGELKQHSRLRSQAAEDRAYLQKLIDHALEQTERVCALVNQIAASDAGALMTPNRKREAESGGGGFNEVAAQRRPIAAGGERPLTRREREVLQLISEGCSNKEGAVRMHISPRTFESHRAEVMRKLGARNTAELVRAALLLRINGRFD